MAISVTPDQLSASPPAPRVAASVVKPPHISWKALAPLGVAAAIALTPTPDGLAPHAWYYFAIFAGVIVALMLEPLPGAAIGVIGVTLATLLAPWVLYSPAELAKPGFSPANAALGWALSGFREQHGVADLRRVHVRAGLRPHGPRSSHLARRS